MLLADVEVKGQNHACPGNTQNLHYAARYVALLATGF